ncbi:MAG: T9SS type A sorting domain-containing protein [Parafilimonas sp.]
MKTLFTIFCIVCTTCLLQAQTMKQVEYFIDTDKGVGKNTKLNLAASNDSSYQFNIDATNISIGFHKLYFRSKDSKGKWSLTYYKNIEIVSSDAQPKIIAGEYFFDKDPGFGKAKKIIVSPQGASITQDFNTVTSSFTNGMHKLFTRFKDSTGNWSVTDKRNVEIIRTADTTKIIAVEYFFSGDKGFGKATAKVFETTAADSVFKFKIPYNKIPANADTLFIRAEDSLGNWSITKYELFSIQSFVKNAIADAIIIDRNKLQVFPNPANNIIHFSCKGMNINNEIIILNANGQLVKKCQPSSAESGEINISDLSSGTYILQISYGETKQSVKFVKQ